MTWWERGACRDLDTTLFFPDQGEPLDKRASDACEVCVVRPSCLDWAVSHELYGYWAGTSQRRREEIRRKLALRLSVPEAHPSVLLTRHGTTAGYKRHKRKREIPCELCKQAWREDHQRRKELAAEVEQDPRGPEFVKVVPGSVRRTKK